MGASANGSVRALVSDVIDAFIGRGVSVFDDALTPRRKVPLAIG